eukprot:14147236-Ditylum_brightwellii.AAC.1
MEEKLAWHGSIVDLIDWEIHRSTISHLDFYQHCFVVKLINERLLCIGEPFTGSEVTICPVCRQHTETFGHFQYCPKNNKSWPDLIKALTSAYSKNNTIADICKRYPTVDFKPYNCLIREQQSIGWAQLRQGRWSASWAAYQQQYAPITNTTPPEDKAQFLTWIGQTIREAWQFQKSWWAHRNACLHYNTQDITKRNLLARITGLYSKQDMLRPKDRLPFSIPLEKWPHKSIKFMRLWIKWNRFLSSKEINNNKNNAHQNYNKKEKT